MNKALFAGLLGLSAAIACGCGGTAETLMAAKAAANAAETAIRAIASNFTQQNNLNWGQPEAIVRTKDRFYVLYPTPAAERSAGSIRAVVVQRHTGAVRQALRGESLASDNSGFSPAS